MKLSEEIADNIDDDSYGSRLTQWADEAAKLERRLEGECKWDDDGTGVYTSACGEDFYGSVNGDFDAPPDFMAYCFCCGKKIDWSVVNARAEAEGSPAQGETK